MLVVFFSPTTCKGRVLSVNPVEDVLYEACNHQITIPYERISRLLTKFEKVQSQELRDKLLNSFMYDEQALIHWSDILTILSSFDYLEYKEKWRNQLINRMARIHVDDVPEFINKLTEKSEEKMTLLSQIKQKINNLTRERRHSISLKIFGIEARLARKASLLLDSFVPDCVYEDLDEDVVVLAIGNEHVESPKPLSKYSNTSSFEALKLATIHALRRLKSHQKFGLVFLTSKFDSVFGQQLVQATSENIRKALVAIDSLEYEQASTVDFMENLIDMFQQDANPKSALYLVGKVTEVEVPAFNVGSQLGRFKRNMTVVPKIHTIGFFVNDSDSLEYLSTISRVYNQYSMNTGGKCIRLYTPQI